MNDDEKNLLNAVFGGPSKYECENCCDAALAETDQLPPGWMVIAATSAKLFKDLNDVDSKSMVVCAICFGLVTRVLKGFNERAAQES